MPALTPVTWVRLKRLNPSAISSSFVPSVMLKRRERRMSRYQILGCLKKLRGRSANLVEPPEPLTPPACVAVPGAKLKLLPLPRVAAAPLPPGFTVPETVAVKRCPENAFKIGAIVQPLSIAREE